MTLSQNTVQNTLSSNLVKTLVKGQSQQANLASRYIVVRSNHVIGTIGRNSRMPTIHHVVVVVQTNLI